MYNPTEITSYNWQMAITVLYTQYIYDPPKK